MKEKTNPASISMADCVTLVFESVEVSARFTRFNFHQFSNLCETVRMEINAGFGTSVTRNHPCLFFS